MDSNTREAIRLQLEQERADLAAQIDTLTVVNTDQENDAGVGNHLADDASDLFLRERDMALHGNAEELIGQIDAALQRLDAGTYGMCARCGQPIDAARLEALPYAEFCITCQAIIERERAA
jgi:RNA polymerase-binding protein DksA